MTTLKSDKTALASEVTSLTSANTSLTNKVTELGNKVSTLTGENANLKSQVTTLNSQLNSLKNASTTSTSASTSTSTSTKPSSSSTSNNTTTQAQTGTGAQSTSKKTNSGSSNNNVGVNAESSEEVSKNSAYVSSSDNTNAMGTAVETGLPSTSEINEVAKNQTAETSLTKLGNQSILVETNAASHKTLTADSKEMAYLILTYYMNHLEELGELGSEEIIDAATDDSKSVSMEVVASIDVEPNETQLAAMKKGDDAELTVTSDKFEDEELYFVVHESDKRADTFDVLLVTAEDNAITMSLPDFSPVTIAKVSIDEVEAEEEQQVITAENSSENADFVAEEVEETENTDNGSFRTIMYVLIILAFVGIVAVFVFMKLQREGKLPMKKK